MKKAYLLLLAFLSFKMIFSQSQMTIGNTAVQVDTVYTGLDVPWEMIYGPDGFLWITERKGLVSRINLLDKTRTVILDIVDEVYQEYEAGLLGMALHPDFPNPPEVFLVYTYGVSPNVYEKVVKYIYNGSVLVDPVILIDQIDAFTTHNGSRLLFQPDGTLLMSTGDAQNQPAAQDPNLLNGKTLRLNADGSIPANNPSSDSYVYTMGHRNIQGMHLAPNGRIYVSEHGPTTDDEFQILTAGSNYGWPDVEGFCDLPDEQFFCNQNNISEPLVTWTPTIAPSDLVYYENAAFPEFDGKILMTVLKEKMLTVIELNTNGTEVLGQANYFEDQFGRLRDIAIGEEREIYLATNGASWENTDPNTHSIIRITPPTEASTGNGGKAEKGFVIYPNPAKEFLTVHLSTDFSASELTITDLQSKLVCHYEITSPQFELNLSGLKKGVYLLKIGDSHKSLMID